MYVHIQQSTCKGKRKICHGCNCVAGVVWKMAVCGSVTDLSCLLPRKKHKRDVRWFPRAFCKIYRIEYLQHTLFSIIMINYPDSNY